MPALVHQKFKLRWEPCGVKRSNVCWSAAAIAAWARRGAATSCRPACRGVFPPALPSSPCFPRSPDGSRLKITLKAQQLEGEWPGVGGPDGALPAVAKQTTTWLRVRA